MTENAAELDIVSSSSNIHHSSMDADLGLFNQLLQMVDGDWSDSIQGICDHVQERFAALGVVLSILDKRFDEFIYIADAFPDNILKTLLQNSVPLENNSAIERMHCLYKGTENFLEQTVFSDEKLQNLASIYFEGNSKKAESVIKNMNLKTIVALPALKENRHYKCFFHIGTDRCFSENTLKQITEYSNQLNLALEIVFLVRDLYIKATHDGLTRLFNHKQGEILLKKEIDRIERSSHPLSIAMIDLDYFKKVNDTYGHQAGDHVLVTVGAILTRQLRKCDIISRYGGEEFLVVLPDTELQSTAAVMERVKNTIESYKFNFDDKSYNVTASIGLAQYNPEKHFSETDLINDCDTLLYSAKNHGRNRMEF